MRELVLKMSMSLDGFVAAPRSESDWMFRGGSPDSMAWVLDVVAGAGVHAFGRKTFERISGFWPTAPGPIAEPMNRIPKVVFTTQRDFDPRTLAVTDPESPAAATWTGARVAAGPLEAEVTALKQESGGYVLAQGGTEFGRSLVRAGLVDEYRLAVLPVALGTGAGIFSGLQEELDLQLVSSTVFEGGAKADVYRPKR
ncbi:dihydrofolate reductase family protein [Curtobacterium flaccumfaciens pv. oortii]|uniref:dihydrofolate reductase family protein n=1 Tax=Curtobacterium flaccumfaciens TaxID=2035 RepID=UPI001BDEF679|nr:dihydrofolate reductase family protein [Curtobacterium flaccumfaciens]MBT1622191.1 dihydrofolate reductase family protein [Curtobacterium flaccumfaciens pv. oortii]